MFDFLKKTLIVSFVFAGWLSVLLFLFYLNINPADLGSFIGSRIGKAVTTTINKASVPENPINKLALELSNKEKELNYYEDFLNQREADIAKNSTLVDNKLLIFFSVIIGFLFLLIFLNFYFDYRRRLRAKKEEGGQSKVL